MDRKLKISVLLLAAGVLAAGGCTVREDRQPCPCFLDVDYREVLAADLFSGEPGTVDVAVLIPGHPVRCTHKLAACPEIEEKTVRRDTAQVVALVSNRMPEGFPELGTEIRYEPGNQMDSLYVHTDRVDCTVEEATCVLKPLKQFSTLTFTDEKAGETLREYNLVVRGSTCGLDAADLSALEGKYLYTVQERDRNGNISVRIPRQTDGSLMLDFYDKDSYLQLFSAPIGLYLFDAGYDPRAPGLEDYTIRINFEKALVYLRIDGWEEEYIYQLYK